MDGVTSAANLHLTATGTHEEKSPTTGMALAEGATGDGRTRERVRETNRNR